MLRKRRNIARSVLAVVLLTGIGDEARAVTLTAGVQQKYLVTGKPVSGLTHSILKLRFENKTSGTSLSLCAGTSEDFNGNACPVLLCSSGGPGFVTLTVTDTVELAGKVLWVKNNGSLRATFDLTIE